VIDEPELRTAVAQRLASPVFGINAFAAQAPVLVAVVTEPSTLTARLGAMLKDKPYHLMDLGIAVEHFCLQAVEEGLGTCIMGWFDETGVKRLLEVPRGKRVHLTVAVGYAASEVVRPKARKDKGDILAFNAYHRPPEKPDASDGCAGRVSARETARLGGVGSGLLRT
jgi:nitroreductase